MKLLKVFGIVAGIHVVALILIFANPGCSTTTKSAATPSDTVVRGDTAPSVSVPYLSGSQSAPAPDLAATPVAPPDAASPVQPAPVLFNPDAPAVAADGRYSPTRPGTPVATALQTSPINDVTPVSTYTVARGDSLWSVAKHNNLTVAELVEANNLKASSTLRLGQKLIIPGKAGKGGGMKAETAAPARAMSGPAPAAAAKAGAESVTHVVKPGETLGAIARKYGVRLGDVATANNITDPAKIRPGMTLVIPGWKAPAGKSGAGAAKAAAPVQDEAPVITPDAPIFTPPPADKPLEQGLK
ncbi:MAG: LysM peptidoglycan-binding domain-containing protein, partial [Opitutales bacterium]